MWQRAKNLYHLLVAVGANMWFLFPSRRLTVIGITGTDGKTTTVHLVYHILKTAGFSVSMISSVGAVIHNEKLLLGFHVTTPSPISLQKFLSRAAGQKKSTKKEYLILEVTSHALDQQRVWGIPFSIAGITNVTNEHLDYHKNYINYVKTKTMLLQRAPITILNKDDSSFSIISPLLSRKKKVITYAIKQEADITPRTIKFTSKFIGTYNMYNALLAVSICKQLGIGKRDIIRGIETFTFPQGRTEIVYKKDFTIMIDFAHTPNAFTQLLSSLRPMIKGNIIHVFGAAGLRDFSKRPEMGRISSELADVIILTAEDPRSENVNKIIDSIESGISKKTRKEISLYKIADRQDAITKAISLAGKDDLVLLTGKAHETSMNLGHGELPWSEYKAVEKALKSKRVKSKLI